MALIKGKFPHTIAVVDHTRSVPARLDMQGNVVTPAQIVTRNVPPGEDVEIEEAEAKAIWERHGPYKEREIVEESKVSTFGVRQVGSEG